MKCANCQAVLSGEPTCPSCGTLYTVPGRGVSMPGLVQELEQRLAKALEGRFELRGLLGHGGMGAVFLAVEVSLDRLVAIKVLPPSLSMDEELLTRFQREARTAARLDHPGIVPIYAVETIDGLHFYVMKFVPGTDLSDEIPEGGMPAERAREILWECAVALGHAHRRGVIHRDVKPANVMIDQSGRAVVTDFGIAKAIRSGTAMTSTGQMIGTPQYMSPEQMEGKEVDGRADQYSLGMVAHHVLAGRQPFGHGSVAALLVKQLSEYPESLAALRPDVPDPIVGAIERAIRKAPDERFETMEDFARALWPERAAGVSTGGGAERAHPGPAGRPTPGSSPMRRWLVGAAVVAALAVGANLARSAFMSGAPDGVELSDGGAETSRPETGVSVAPEQPAEVTPVPSPAGGSALVSEAPDSTPSQTAEGAATLGQTASGAGPGGTVEQPPERDTETETQATTGGGGNDPVEEVVGFLSVNARPFAYVDIDGLELQESTPIHQRPLSPGPHVVVIRREGYVTVVDTVEITAGNVTTHSVVLVPN
jgi:hypothetical protein